MLAYLTGGLGIIAVAATAYAASLRAGHADLQHQLQDTTFQLTACGGRLTSLVTDLRDDHAIDQLPDTALVDVPDHWMQPANP